MGCHQEHLCGLVLFKKKFGFFLSSSVFFSLNWAEPAVQTCQISKHLSPATPPQKYTLHIYVYAATHTNTHQRVDWRNPLIYIYKKGEDTIGFHSGKKCQCFSVLMRVACAPRSEYTHTTPCLPLSTSKSHTASKMLMVVNEAEASE